MFGKRSFASSKDRSGKITKQPKKSFRGDISAPKQKQMATMAEKRKDSPMMADVSPRLTSAIVTLVVGSEERLFAAHEDVLSHSPYFTEVLQGQFFECANRRINLPSEEPEIFACILEYLYKGDYYPRLLHDKRRQTFILEGAITSPDPNKGDRVVAVEPTFFHTGVGDVLLRDTAVYCAADRYGLEELKKLSLRKQGLQSGIEVGTILRSARYAYENTPDSDSRLRAHYLALIIRSRKTFKRSGTMQMEMEMGGKLFFDLFVAMCNHVDDLTDASNPRGTPKTI
ncbi:hypothetical protein GQ44DRAFT_177796 [Phaeosphaeriaceae sp. PMI808]|nr:hypothetical protein GQ44DRAFT_177796 [Phaeosphaeriaceae sp. PMI808]